jgi:hypothetical protein
MIEEQSVECEVAGETEVLGENLPHALRPPQIPHNLTWARTIAAAVGSWRQPPKLWHGLPCHIK